MQYNKKQKKHGPRCCSNTIKEEICKEMSKVVSEVEENVEKGIKVDSEGKEERETLESGKRKRMRSETNEAAAEAAEVSEGTVTFEGSAFTGCKLCFYFQSGEGEATATPTVGEVGGMDLESYPWTYSVEFICKRSKTNGSYHQSLLKME